MTLRRIGADTGQPRCLVTRNIGAEHIDRLTDYADILLWDSKEKPIPRNVMLNSIKDCEGILCMLTERIDGDVLAVANQLRFVASMSVGVDHIDLAKAHSRGILVSNTPEVLTDATADLAWALILSASRRIPEMQRVVEQGQWKTWSADFGVGLDVFGRSLGVVGAGRVGAAVLKRGIGFDMDLFYTARRRSEEAESCGAVYQPELEKLLSVSDIVVVAVPLTDETSGLFSKNEFRSMRRDSIFVNISRGAVVDESALINGLKRGQPWAAGLDVFVQEPLPTASELLNLPNCICIPHIGSATKSARNGMAKLAAENLVRGFSGGQLLTPVRVAA